MPRRAPRPAILLLVAVTACGAALQPLQPLQPLPPMAPLPELAPLSPSAAVASAPAPAPASAGAAEHARLGVNAPERDLALESLRERGLLVPVQGVTADEISDSYDAPRDDGRVHRAQDILAKRGTPVLAADDGVILHVGTNTLGGNVIWQTDPSRKFAFYYAHLERYAKGLRDGQAVRRGQVIGYVGTSGNAPKNIPHLHFQVVRIVSGTRYSEGPPVNPLAFFIGRDITR
jgi:murein DD-endopeptidase MepM/ murein hydrolase activator NlpD